MTPHLTVNGAAAYAEFLKRAFGGVEIARSPENNGKLMHVEVRVGDSMVMFSDDFGVEFGQPPLAEGRLPFLLWLYVPDVDAVFAQAVAAGAKQVMPVSDQFWGDRHGALEDPFGIAWAIATRKEDLTMEEIHERQVKAFGGA